jgi:hypothetical protein
MNKKYILSKTIFASILAVGLLAGTLAMAQTTSDNPSAVTQATNTQGNSQNPNVPSSNIHYGNSMGRGLSGRMPVAGFGRGSSLARNVTATHRSTGMFIWSAIVRLITTILLWVIMIQIIILLFWKIKSHAKQKP